MSNKDNVTASQIVIALADMASNGKYDNVTPQQAQNMNALFEAVAQVINQLEKAEGRNEKEQIEKAKQDAQAILMDEEEIIEGDVS